MKMQNLDGCIQLHYLCENRRSYKDTGEDDETRSDASSFELDHCLKEKIKNRWINQKWIRWTNHERICWVKSKEFVGLRAKTYICLKDNNEDRRAKGTKCVS